MHVRIGIFVIFATAILLFLSLRLVKISEIRGYEINIILPSAEGLSKETPIFMSGIEIGKIKRLKLSKDGKKAIAESLIFEGTRITKDAQVKLKLKGVLGDKYILFIQGDSKDYISEGGSIEVAEKIASPEEILENITNISEKINEIADKTTPLIKETETGIKTTFSKINLALDGINETISYAKQTVSEARDVVRNVSNSIEAQKIAEIISQIDRTSKNLEQMSETIKGETGNIVEDVKETSKNIKEITNKTKTILDKLESGEGILGKLISGQNDIYPRIKKTVKTIENLSAQVTTTAKNLEKTSERIESLSDIGVNVGLRSEFSPSKNYYSQNLYVRLNKKKLETELGIIAPPFDITQKDTSKTLNLRGNILVGGRFKYTVLKAGLIRSSPGLSAYLTPFPILSVGVESFLLERLSLRGVANIKPIPNLIITGGVENSFQNNIFFPFLGLGFETK